MSYRGLVAPIPLADEGLTGNKNLSQVRPTQLLRATNITLENGTVQKEGGTEKYNDTAITGAPTILGGADWWPSDGVQRMVILTSAGTLYKDDGTGSFGTTLDTGLTVSNVVPVFVEGGQESGALDRKLFVFTGKNAVQVLAADGATTSDLSGPPVDWSGAAQPVTGLNHEGRLWGFLRHQAYYSTTSDHEDFTSGGSGSLGIYPGEGEKIVAAFVYGPYIVVGKTPRGIYMIDTTDPDVSNWKVRRLSAEVGVAGPRAHAVLEGDAIIVDPAGEYYALSSFSELQDIRPRSLTQEAVFSPFLRENTNPAQLAKVTGINYINKRQVWFAVAGSGSTVNNARVKLDFNKATPRFSFSTFVDCESLWLRKDANGVHRPMAGDDTGFVRHLDQAGYSHDGTGYTGEWQTPYTDLSFVEGALGNRRKNFDFLELHYEPRGEWNLTVDVLIDGDLQQTVTFSMGGGSGCILGSWILDSDTLGGDQVRQLRKRISGSGRRISLLGRQSGDGQDFSIAAAFLSFRPADERTF